ncbi:MAG TPA: zinc-finger domain-containing protein [Stellaceae bacterium]|nr:zinc-finger domain-containing protein [Stellaceae bacterium]
MQPFETIEVQTTIVACDGGGGTGGHPKVYLNLGPHGSIECPYCSRFFVLRRPGAAPAQHNPAP